MTAGQHNDNARNKAAVIDIGSNSVRLLLAEMDGARFLSRQKFLTTTRIAEGLADSGNLAQPAMARTRVAVDKYRRQALSWGAEQVYCYATSAVRDAGNGGEFMAQLSGLDRLQAEIISGQAEAECAYLGAQSALPEMSGAAVLDVGGASTELITMDDELRACSVAMGCVRCKEMFVSTDPIRTDEAAALEAYCREHALQLAGAVGRTAGLIGVGGSVTQLAMLLLELDEYDPQRITGLYMSTQQLAELYNVLLSKTVAQRRRMPGMEEQRADIIPMGAAIVLAVLSACGADGLYASDGDGLEGYLLQAVR